MTVQAVEVEHEHSTHSLIGSHGMVLIHHQNTGFYASHMPLYNSPHNYQIIYKVQIDEHEKLNNLLKNGLVTLLPERFDLSKLVNGESLSIKTSFFKGHFERGGSIKFTSKIRFERPLLIKKIEPNYKSNRSEFYSVAVSSNVEIIAHKIQQVPSFDAIGFMEKTLVKKTKKTPKLKSNIYSCEKPQHLTIAAIEQKLDECLKIKAKYIESMDFS